MLPTGQRVVYGYPRRFQAMETGHRVPFLLTVSFVYDSPYDNHLYSLSSRSFCDKVRSPLGSGSRSGSPTVASGSGLSLGCTFIFQREQEREQMERERDQHQQRDREKVSAPVCWIVLHPRWRQAVVCRVEISRHLSRLQDGRRGPLRHQRRTRAQNLLGRNLWCCPCRCLDLPQGTRIRAVVGRRRRQRRLHLSMTGATQMEQICTRTRTDKLPALPPHYRKVWCWFMAVAGASRR